MRSTDIVRHIYIDESLKDSLVGQSVIERVPQDVRIKYIEDSHAIREQFRQKGEIGAKDTLLIYPHQGNFFSTCPGSDGMVCCQYFVINLGQGCLFDCHYCYLQSFLNNPLMTIFGNMEELFSQLDKSTRGKNFHFRVGTGEHIDSLALEHLTGQATHLIHYFANHPNATLELKTKSSNIDSLQNKAPWKYSSFLVIKPPSCNRYHRKRHSKLRRTFICSSQSPGRWLSISFSFRSTHLFPKLGG